MKQLSYTPIEQKILKELCYRYPNRVSTVRLARITNSFATSTAVSKLRRKMEINSLPYTVVSEYTQDPEKKYFYRLEMV